MTKPSFTTNEVEGNVKGWKAGGAYVTVPSSWIGKRVRITVIEE